MRHIMVATDGSNGANRAVDVAAGLARALAGDLLIATVADPLSGEEARQLARAEGSIGDALEALTAQTLNVAEARARHLARVGRRLIFIPNGSYPWIQTKRPA